MANDPVEQLLDEIFESERTPEEVCAAYPRLLPEVRRRWQQMCLVEAGLEALFPRSGLESSPWHSEADLPRIPGYEVETVLGRGGMGMVFKAQHMRLNRPVALKMLLVGAGATAAERERFLREAEAVAGLQHPNIVQVYDAGEQEGRLYFTMEFLEGGSLARRLAGRSLPPCDAARLVRTLAEAMHLAHSRNLVHRDLKPANVLLTGDPDTPIGLCQPKVTDFGLVRQLDSDSGQTRFGLVIGTPSYMAPEQAEESGPCRRACRGCLCVGGYPLRMPDGPAAVPGGDAASDTSAGLLPGSCRAVIRKSPGAPRPGDHLPEVPGQGAGPALFQRPRVGRGPGQVSSR